MLRARLQNGASWPEEQGPADDRLQSTDWLEQTGTRSDVPK